MGNDQQWRRLCAVIGLDALADDPGFATNSQRVVNHDRLRPILSRTLATRDRARWIEELMRAGVPAGAVRSIAETFSDAQLDSREMIQWLTHSTAGPIQVLGSPIKLSDTPASIREPPPTLGQHTETVLDELGLSQEHVRRLRAEGVIQDDLASIA